MTNTNTTDTMNLNVNNDNSFTALGLIQPLYKAVTDLGYKTPSPIQEQAIPILLQRRDILGCAQTGTGKTAAFALPILQNLVVLNKKTTPNSPKVLVLTPTRELAIQIFDSFKQYGKYLKFSYGVLLGGVGQGPQVQLLNRGVDILIATPGRLLDLIQQRHLKLNQLDTFVLDEADRMLDMGFIHDIKKILTYLPKDRHNLFFSATIPSSIQKLADSMLNDPISISVTPVSSTAELIQQSVLYVDKSQKRELLKFVLKDPKLKKVIVFTRTKHGANRVVEMLNSFGVTSEAIHGNKSQNARQRALDNFKSGRSRVLVATDIAARGIDIDDISHVINFEIPNVSESYVHRIGRTARAGASGIAISFCDLEEKAFIKDIEKTIGQSIPVNDKHPFHSENILHAKPLSKGKAKAILESKQNRFKRPGGAGGGGKKKFFRPKNRSASASK